MKAPDTALDSEVFSTNFGWHAYINWKFGLTLEVSAFEIFHGSNSVVKLGEIECEANIIKLSLVGLCLS